MIPNSDAVILVVGLIAIAVFCGWSMKQKTLHLMNKLFIALVIIYAVWVLALLGMKFTPSTNTALLFVFDCVTQLATVMAVIYLCIAIVFVNGYDRMPKWIYSLFVVPIITILVCCTNPLHHLQYKEFSVVKSEIVFGPFVLVSGVYSYFCLIVSIALMIRFAIKNRSRLYLKQSLLFSAGGLSALIVSIVATFSTADLAISATALSFIPVIVFDGIAIYQLHLLDLKPIATQRVLDGISDCYLLLSDKGLICSYNKSFETVFASQYGIKESRYLKDCIREEDISKKTAIYVLMTAIRSCMEAESVISYEQSMTVKKENGVQKYYYIAEVSPLIVNKKNEGFVVIFKDITQLKKSMQQLQDNQTRMIEQERFAFLGQMIAGLAHNLKTPIMSISGCVSSVESLVDECSSSLQDPQVVAEDYAEIYGEIRDWLGKIQDSTAYMSEIITAIKGQASSVSTFGDNSFTLDELMKRTMLLMRHELMSSGCRLIPKYDPNQVVRLNGDINNLVQVLDNLLCNAIYAQKNTGNDDIFITIEVDDEKLQASVRDSGCGVAPEVRDRLFRGMVTNKGTKGSGLGLYISNTVIRGKFGGEMWVEDNPGGGAIFGFSIPLNKKEGVNVNEAE